MDPGSRALRGAAVRLQAAAFAASAFAELGISVSLWSRGDWQTIHRTSNDVVEMEVQRQSELARWDYNERSIARARSSGRSVLGSHAGFHDLFVPIADGRGVVIAGPFAREPPSSAEVVERWQSISRSRATLADPAFCRYLDSTLETLTLEGPLLSAFQALIECFARVIAGQGDSLELARRWAGLLGDLSEARGVERMWDAARSMIDERTTQRWSTAISRDALRAFGLARAPDHTAVCLFRDRRVASEAIDAALRRHALQRSVSRNVLRRGRAVCGRVGDHGVVLLVVAPRGEARARAAVADVVERTASVARRSGFALHAGVAPVSGADSLATAYRAALGAAERALSRGNALTFAATVPPPAATLAQLRTRLALDVEERPDLLGARFEPYLDSVLAAVGYRLDAAHIELQVGLERLSDRWLASGDLDAKTFAELCASIETAPRGIPTVAELVASYRRVVAEITRLLSAPTLARQTHGIERALDFMRDRMSESLTVARVARVARFAPGHFARLFRRAQGEPFERHLRRLRLERAKHMLTSTSLPIGSLAERCGFRSRTHFQRAFRQIVGETPNAYRLRTRR